MAIVTSASLQVADVIIVSVDTRGFSVAEKLARRGWKTVVIELSGSAFTERDWADRLGPFLAWEQEGSEPIDSEGRPLRSEYPAMWLPSGPVSFGGRTAASGVAHLAIRYGVNVASEKANPLAHTWPEALMQSLVASKLARREVYANSTEATPKLPLRSAVKNSVSADAVARARREAATSAGVRIIEAEQIVGVRVSDCNIDRVEFRTREGVYSERTRSLVWTLSEEESKRVEFVGPEVPLEEFFFAGTSEPLMAWWRSRLAVRGLKRSSLRALTRVPVIPPHVVVVGSVERPWSHENLVLLDVVEETSEMRVFDVWTRIPYWARADHVYRDEQRLLVHNLLSDRLIGCELIWVTPSPLALTEPAIRMPHILYAENSKPARAKLGNICFAGPETWGAVGLRGLRPMEDQWLKELEVMRIQWDPVARMKATRGQKMKYAFKNLLRTRATNTPNNEASP